jgi:IS1 family transposase
VSFRHGIWLWVVVSRVLGLVLAFGFERRTLDALAWVWTEVPKAWAEVPVFTDGLVAYAAFFAGLPDTPHEACDKGSGKTSRAEGMNNLWRQRQSGLCRKSSGVCWRIEDDLYERMLILADKSNRQRIEKWQWEQTLEEIRQSQSPLQRSP